MVKRDRIYSRATLPAPAAPLRDLQASFYEYLDQQFGPGFSGLVRPPAGVQIGERVLYLLAGGQEAQRADIEQANREFEEGFARLVAELAEAIDGLQYHTEPAVSSGLPYPRAVDIPHAAELALGSLAAGYAAGPDELPEQDFALRWLFGVIFAHSAKTLLYLDFTHPKLRALYVAEYDVAYEFLKGRDIPEQLRAFMARQAELAEMVSARQDVAWAKLVQIDTAVQTMIKTHDNLTQK